MSHDFIYVFFQAGPGSVGIKTIVLVCLFFKNTLNTFSGGGGACKGDTTLVLLKSWLWPCAPSGYHSAKSQLIYLFIYLFTIPKYR